MDTNIRILGIVLLVFCGCSADTWYPNLWIDPDLHQDDRIQLNQHPYTNGENVSIDVDAETSGSRVFCEQYCNSQGLLMPSQECNSDEFCCGDEFNRVCCDDESQDIGGRYPPVSTCSGPTWWYYQWRIIVGLLSSLIIILVCAACCYYCCGGSSPSSRQRTMNLFGRSRSNPGTSNRGENTLEGSDNQITTFDPESPNAFAPPEYDSLPKEPPKYSDIFGMDNEAFQAEELSNENHPVEEQSPRTEQPPNTAASMTPVEDPEPALQQEQESTTALPTIKVIDEDSTHAESSTIEPSSNL